MKDKERIIIMPEISPVCTELLSEVFRSRDICLQVFSTKSKLVEVKEKSWIREDGVHLFAKEVSQFIASFTTTPDIKILFLEWDPVFSDVQEIERCKSLLYHLTNKEIPMLSLGISRWSWKGTYLFTPKFIKQTIISILYADVLIRSFESVRPIERIENSTGLLLQVWIEHAKKNIREVKIEDIAEDLASIVIDFDFLKKKHQNPSMVSIVSDVDFNSIVEQKDSIISIEQSGYKTYISSSIHGFLYHLLLEHERIQGLSLFQWKSFFIEKLLSKIDHILETIAEVTEYSGVIPTYTDPKRILKKASSVINSDKKQGPIWNLLLEIIEMQETGVDIVFLEYVQLTKSNSQLKSILKKVKKIYPNNNASLVEIDLNNTPENNTKKLQHTFESMQKKDMGKLQDAVI